jgi:hypothetical protein
MPSAKATTTNASQPNVAVFQWSALQRPIRAARLLGFVPDMIFLSGLKNSAIDGKSAAAKRRRRKAGIELRPGADSGSYPGRRRRAGPRSTFTT